MADFRRGQGNGRYQSNQSYKGYGGRSRRGRSSYRGSGRDAYHINRSEVIPVQRLRKDDDVQMNGDDSDRQSLSINRRFDPISQQFRRGGRFRGGVLDVRQQRRQVDWTRGHGGSTTLRILSSLPDSQSDWYKIIIPRGKNCGQDFLLNNLRSSSAVPFEPINFHYAGLNAIFFVRRKDAALSLIEISSRLTLPDGSKLIVRYERLTTKPSIVMTDEVCEKLKLCMSKRYDVATCALNMSNFIHDPDMEQANLPLDVARPQVAERVVSIIAEHIPELKSLDLSNNRLSQIKHFTLLGKSAVNLQQLNLAQNRLTNERELLCLGITSSLQDLVLEKNPLCDTIGDKQTYISAIRKIFPKLLRLDGQVLPAPITFDVDTPTNLPEAKGSQFGSEQIQAVICSFINWYFARYDCDDRQQLLDVYHPQAIFSLSTHNYKVSGRNVNWTDYQNHCRNLKWAKEHQKQSRLAHGRADVVAVLCKLPPTQHSPESFVIDVGVSTPHMLTFSIQGVCKDRSSKLGKSTVRHFSRTFVTVPSNAEPGVAIINEMLVLSGAPTKEVEKYGKNLDSAPASAISSATSFDASSATVGGALTDLQQQMVQQFSVQSGMNATWSARCLSENNWDYAKAAQNFLEVNEKHMIPPEAFVQS